MYLSHQQSAKHVAYLPVTFEIKFVIELKVLDRTKSRWKMHPQIKTTDKGVGAGKGLPDSKLA